MKTLLLFLLAIASAQASESSSSDCQSYCDLICRQYRSDLKPVELRLSKRNAGDFYVYTLAMRIKNVGESPVGQPGQVRYLDFYSQDLGTKSLPVSGRFEPGQSKWVGLGGVNVNLFAPCSKLQVSIDRDRAYGQWGCVVHANDTALLTILEAGKKNGCRPVLNKIPKPKKQNVEK